MKIPIKSGAPISKKPNIIICTCDQLRAFELGCYGNDVIQSPNIDRLASEGVRFETALSNCPVCMAARSIILSGQYNRTCTGGVSNVACEAYVPAYPDGYIPGHPYPARTHLKEQTLPEILQSSGYYTGVIGKWHIHSWPHDIGFHHYLLPRARHCYTGQHYTENGGPEFVAPGYSVDFEAERVKSFLKERSKHAKQPFFLNYNISPPHCPMSDAPEKYTKMYAPDTIPVRPNVDLDTPLQDKDILFKIYRWDFRYYNFHLPYTEEFSDDFTLRDVIALYYGMTTWVDDTVGRMLAVLEETGQADNTIIIFTSDHGDNLGSHGLVQKETPNDEAIRIPFLLRWPGKVKNSAVIREQVASLVDIAPTILSIAGIPVPKHIQGQNLAPVVCGQHETLEQDYAIIEIRLPVGIAVRTATHMYFVPFSGKSGKLEDKPTKFYDLTIDPYELDNLAGSDRSAKIAKRLDNCLRKWHRSTPWMRGT